MGIFSFRKNNIKGNFFFIENFLIVQSYSSIEKKLILSLNFKKDSLVCD